jgi:CheY-like chemotaxis protein
MTTHAGASILIVDDEAQVRTFAARLLTQHGFRCAEASSAG